MARRFVDTCGDVYSVAIGSLGLWSVYGGSPPPGVVSGISGATGNCIQVSQFGNGAIKKPIGFTSSEVIHGVRLQWNTLPGYSNTGWGMLDTAQAQVFFVACTTSGALEVYDHNNTLVGTSATGVVVAGVWNYYEFHVVQSATVGSIEVKQAGDVILTLTGLNTSADQIAYISGGVNGTVYCDDIYINDTTGAYSNTYDGDQSLYFVTGEALGTVDEWSYSGGASAWQSVNTITPETNTDYISAPPTGLPLTERVSSFTLPGTASTILCVSPVYCGNNDSGGGSTINSVLHSGAGDASGTSIAFTTSEQMFIPDHYSLSPLTGIAWTPTEIETQLELGVKRTA
jgi:hypothetical protein